MSEQSKLRVGVIGTGMMGRNHARVLADMPGVELVGVADLDMDAASAIAYKFHCDAFESVDALLDAGVDAVSVAVPTSGHLTVAGLAIDRGVHVLVEKPIASTVADGALLAARADAAGVKLMVGHIERFNPAITMLKTMLDAGEAGRVFQIEARRQGPFPSRVMDVGVTIDLAVHDVDIVRYITGSEVSRVVSEMASRVRGGHEDSLFGLLRLDDGTMANLSINWLTPTKIRTLTVVGERGTFVVDYLTQDLCFYENAEAPRNRWETLTLLRGIGQGRMIRHVVPRKEPLVAELEAFVACVRDDTAPPVGAADGLAALVIAESLLSSADGHEVVPTPHARATPAETKKAA